MSHQTGNGEFGPGFFSISEVQGKRQNGKSNGKAIFYGFAGCDLLSK